MYTARVMRSAAHEIRDIARAGTPTQGHLSDRLVGAAMATLAVDLACAALALLLEHEAKQTQITSFASALFSSSIQNPISVGGRILDARTTAGWTAGGAVSPQAASPATASPKQCGLQRCHVCPPGVGRSAREIEPTCPSD
jgi:hypothetical protein